MTSEDKCAYTQYYYNSVIEFIYFIFLYLETYGTISLIALSKHVKFFKIEVANLISSFKGNTFEDKLFQMLNMLDCFLLCEKEVKIKKINSKNIIFEDLVLSKCVDLILKGSNSIDDICKNLNYNNVIFINKKNLLHIIEKYSYISVNTDETVLLHHVHGLLGFENYLCNCVISYFYEILFHGKILSVYEIKDHSKLLTFCGIHNMITIFSILNCSNQFICQDGNIFIKKKSKKYSKQLPIDVQLMEAKLLSSRSLPIGQVVYSVYGPFLQKWSGEIGKLTESSGNIDCVVDFTNGQQAVFNIYFSKATLKSISDIGNLKKYLKMWDSVEFDAEYYNSKKLDRCWKATRVKLLCSNKFDYNDILSCKLRYDSESYRNQCVNCYSNESYSLKIKNSKYKEEHVSEKLTTSDYESSSLSNSIHDLDTITNNINKHIAHEKEIANSSCGSISNVIILDYVIMFGYIHMLMQDKAVAIAMHGKEKYNVLFMKESVYLPNDLKNVFVKGQKIIAFIPYLDKLESFPVATLVYTLNDQQTLESDKTDVLPQEFADKLFLQNTSESLCNKFCTNYCNIVNDLIIIDRYITDLKLKMQITELYNFITSQHKVPFQYNLLLQFLYAISKTNFNGFNCSDEVFHFMVKLSRYLKKYSILERHTAKGRIQLGIEDGFGSQINVLSEKFFVDGLPKRIIKENNATNSNLSVKSISLDGMQDSLTSLSSFKTCSSEDSIGSFYSCEENELPVSQNLSSSSLSPSISTVNIISPSEITDTEFEQTGVFPRILIEDTSSLVDSSQLKLPVSPNLSSSSKSLSSSLLNSTSISAVNIIPPSEITNTEFKPTELIPRILIEDTSLLVDSSQLKLPVSQNVSSSSLISPNISAVNIISPSEITNNEFEQTEVYPRILIEDTSLLVDSSQLKTKVHNKNYKKGLKKSSSCKYLCLQSVPYMKCSVKKQKSILFPYMLKSLCKNCVNSSLNVTAYISMISNSFFFFTTKINGHDVVLPFPKQNAPESLQEKVKLNSCCEITVIPTVLVHLSHVKECRIII